MGLAFLPWERLPAWLTGPILVLAGVFILFQAEPYSWEQGEAVAMVVGGVWMFVSGVRTLLAEPDTVPQVNRIRPAHPGVPDYARYSERELRQVLTRIDRERFPGRVNEIETRLAVLEFQRDQPIGP